MSHENRLFGVFLTCVVALFSGCAAHSQTALLASAVSVKESATLDVTPKMLDDAARVANVTAPELGSYALTAGPHSKAELETLSKSLNAEDEQGLLDLVQIIRRNVDAGWVTPYLPEFARSVLKLVEGQYRGLFESVLGETDRDLLLTQLKALAESKQEPRPEHGPAAPPPAAPNRGAAPGNGEAWNNDGMALQQVVVFLERVEKGAQRRLSTKRRLRGWIDSEISKHPFNPSVSLTLDVANPHDRPVVITEIAYVSMHGVEPRAFTMRSRDCNDAVSACRIVYSYDLTQHDLDGLKRQLGQQFQGANERFTQQMRSYLDQIDVKVEVFVDGHDQSLNMPGKLIRVE